MFVSVIKRNTFPLFYVTSPMIKNWLNLLYRMTAKQHFTLPYQTKMKNWWIILSVVMLKLTSRTMYVFYFLIITVYSVTCVVYREASVLQRLVVLFLVCCFCCCCFFRMGPQNVQKSLAFSRGWRKLRVFVSSRVVWILCDISLSTLVIRHSFEYLSMLSCVVILQMMVGAYARYQNHLCFFNHKESRSRVWLLIPT